LSESTRSGRPLSDGNGANLFERPVEEVYAELRRRAKAVARELGKPSFYRDREKEVRLSFEHFRRDDRLRGLRARVGLILNDDFGHGMRHTLLVTRDAGALVLIRAAELRMSRRDTDAALLRVQAAGLLHDLRRKEPRHALKGAEAARAILPGLRFRDDEIEDVAAAIANHEAFQTPEPLNTPAGQVVSDCLYDADKFRWGPDNFTDTVWCMVLFHKVPLTLFCKAWPQGIWAVERVRDSFRTPAGMAYGAEMIEMGLQIGRRVISPLVEES